MGELMKPSLKNATWSYPFRMRLPITRCVLCENRIWRNENALTTMSTDRPFFAHVLCAKNAGMEVGK